MLGVFGCLVWVGQTGFVEATPSSLYEGHCYPVETVSHCVWLYHRFPLSLREIKELMLARGFLITYESIISGAASSVRPLRISSVTADPAG